MTTATDDKEFVSPHARFRRSNIHLASLAMSALLVIFMVSVLGLRYVVGEGGMVWIRQSIWFVLLFYLNFQLLETCRRPSTDMRGFAIDSAIAIVVVMLGFAFFLLAIFVDWFRAFGAEERSILWQCTAFGATDVIWGVMISLRIAFSGKEREEFRGQR